MKMIKHKAKTLIKLYYNMDYEEAVKFNEMLSGESLTIMKEDKE